MAKNKLHEDIKQTEVLFYLQSENLKSGIQYKHKHKKASKQIKKTKEKQKGRKKERQTDRETAGR